VSDSNKEQEQKYFERLNISVLSINRIKGLIKSDIKRTINAWEKGSSVDKQCWHVIGPAGVGKTQICYQIASELTNELKKPFDIIMVKSPVLSRDDFIIPFPTIELGEDDCPVQDQHGNVYSFRMLYSDFVPKNEDTYGLFVIDEFSRGDHTLQQLLWQVQNEYAIHRYEFPKGWFVISIDNPDDQEYQMDTMEDAAGLRRQNHIYSEVSVKDFLDHAIANNFHPLVVEFIQTHPDYIYDFEAQKRGSVYANPASYEKLSDHLIKMELDEGIDFGEIDVIASGLLNSSMTRMFIEFARDKKDINPKDVFYSFDKIKGDIEKLKKNGDNDKLGQLMVGFCTFMTTSMPKYDAKQLQNVLDFLLIMPIDTAALFISQIDSFSRQSTEFKYMTKIHVTLLNKSKVYKKDFYDPIVAVGESA
jgi:hypothetical protein